jgi:hypothetical protein
MTLRDVLILVLSLVLFDYFYDWIGAGIPGPQWVPNSARSIRWPVNVDAF